MIAAMIRFAVIALALLAPLLLPCTAQAELTLCNRTSYVVDAALAFERRASFATRGWFRVDPGQCRKVIETPLEADSLYLHARTAKLYGTAPLPQAGHVDLCVRDGDFEIANARSCPSTVRFTAISPAATDKGPTATLAEEADYDFTQARLAGIQRLLTIAGYDAYPIDGVQGSKTNAALNKFLTEQALPAGSPTGEKFFDVLLKAAASPQGSGFSWCNEVRYPVMAALGIVEMGTIVTRGWYRIEPGECLRPDIRGTPLKVYSYAEAVDGNGIAIKTDGKTLSWGGEIALCTRDGKFELAEHKDCAGRGLTESMFAAVDLAAQPAVTVRFKEP
ncbi:MAG: DUF1036 domain-containing protein [Pseudolabrys sp.]